MGKGRMFAFVQPQLCDEPMNRFHTALPLRHPRATHSHIRYTYNRYIEMYTNISNKFAFMHMHTHTHTHIHRLWMK